MRNPVISGNPNSILREPVITKPAQVTLPDLYFSLQANLTGTSVSGATMNGTVSSLQIATVVISILIVIISWLSYYQRHLIRAYLDFELGPMLSFLPRISGNNFDVRLIRVTGEHLDIKKGLENSKGIDFQYELVDVDDENPELMPSVPISREEPELFLINISYDGRVNFEPLSWWIHFWPPERFQIYIPDELDEVDLADIRLEDTTFHETKAWLLDPADGLTYNNLAYSYTQDKQLYPLRRGSSRFRLNLYTPGHNIFVPIWVNPPDYEEYPSWLQTDSVRNRRYHALHVDIDPQGYPKVDEDRRIRLDLGGTWCDKNKTVHTAGYGNPQITVVGCVHGDENCGQVAIERFLDEQPEIQNPAKFIIANEKARMQGSRYIDVDLNRAFPGDINSNQHEEALAASLLNEIGDSKVLDLHSTKTYNEPFALVQGLDETTIDLVRATGVDRVVDISEAEGGFIGEVQGVAVECGLYQTETANENAYEILRNVLAKEGVIDEQFTVSDPEFYEIDRKITDSNLVFTGENFEKVHEGEPFAKDGDEPVYAKRDFYPVLMGGYEDILGFQATKKGTLSDVYPSQSLD